MSKEYNFDEYKKDELTRPRDKAWGNWKSWKDSQIGDKVQGYIADAFYRPEEKDEQGNIVFREQRGITIEQKDGELINVGVKFMDFILAPTDNLRVGDPLTIELTEIQKPTSKARQGAKIFGYFGTNLPENEGNQTVKELTDEDKGVGGSKAPEEEVKGEELVSEDEPF